MKLHANYRRRRDVGGSALYGDGAVIVAVPVVRVMQMPTHQIVDVAAVRDRLMPAVRAVHVRGVVLAAVMPGCTVGRVLRPDLKCVLVYVVAVGMVQMPVVKVVDMALMLHGGMPAPRTMLMLVAGMDVVLGIIHGAHDKPAIAVLSNGVGFWAAGVCLCRGGEVHCRPPPTYSRPGA